MLSSGQPSALKVDQYLVLIKTAEYIVVSDIAARK